MSQSQKLNLENLSSRSQSQRYAGACARPVETACEKKEEMAEGYSYSYAWSFWVWWIILAIIIGIILVVVRPCFIVSGVGSEEECNTGKCSRKGKGKSCENVENDCGCINWCALFLWAIVISLIIVGLIWLFSSYACCAATAPANDCATKC